MELIEKIFASFNGEKVCWNFLAISQCFLGLSSRLKFPGVRHTPYSPTPWRLENGKLYSSSLNRGYTVLLWLLIHI